MARRLRFAIPSLIATLAAVLWFAFGSYARQIEARWLCADWPDCYRAAAVSASDVLVESSSLMMAWHLADFLMAAALTWLVALGWWRRKYFLDRRWLVPAAGLLLVASTSGTRLAYTGPGVAFWQFLVALTLVTALWWLVLRERRLVRPLTDPASVTGLRRYAWLGVGLTGLACALGAWATVHGIGLVCPDFPMCRGQWWPSADFYALVSEETHRPELEAAIALTLSHRLIAGLAGLYILWLGLHVWRYGHREHLCRFGVWLLAALLVVVTLGIMAAVTRLPAVTALAHSAASLLLIGAMATLLHVASPMITPGRYRT